MAFSPKDTKLLWGRAAGLCSNPNCRTKLTAVGAEGVSFLTGEMAHQIAQSPDGPRGVDAGGDDTYDNLILLCPQCHRTIDKAPVGTYSVEDLKRWKETHESWVDSWSTEGSYTTSTEVAREVHHLLVENRLHFEEYGPKSKTAASNPASNAQTLWVARKLDTIIPNNRRILAVLEKHKKIMPASITASSQKFRMHAQAFEDNQYERVDAYPLFPEEFASEIEELAK